MTFCSKFVWRKSLWRKNDKYEVCQIDLYIKEREIKFLFQYHTSNVCMVSQRMLPVALSFLSHDLSAGDFDAFALLKEGAAYNDYLGELRLFLKNPQAGIPS